MGSNVIVGGIQQGAFLFYESKNLKDFKQIGTYTKSNLGHIWECSDYFEINDVGYAILSPEETMPNCTYPSHFYITKVKFDYNKNF